VCFLLGLRERGRTRLVNVGFDDNIDASNAVELPLDVLVFAIVAFCRHIPPASIIMLLVTYLQSASYLTHYAASNIPSTRISSFANFAASFLPLSDSIHEL
jgi:hypothetical protein